MGQLRVPRRAAQGGLGEEESGAPVSGRGNSSGQGQEAEMAGGQRAPKEGRAGSGKVSHRAGLCRPRGRVWILF